MLLRTKSWHSLRYGLLPPTAIVEQAVQLGHQVVGLTDINTITGIYDFILAAQQQGVKPIVGMELRRNRDNELLYLAYARNATGLQQLNAFRTQHNLAATPLPRQAPQLDHVHFVYPFTRYWSRPPGPREWLAVDWQHVHLLHGLTPEWRTKCLILPDVTLGCAEDYEFHRVLRAIANNSLLSKLPPGASARPDAFARAWSAYLKHYAAYPQLARQTALFAADCNFTFDFAAPKNKQSYTGDAYSDRELLASLAKSGLKARYGRDHAAARERLRKELAMIEQLEFTAHFLIAWDIIRYSKSQGFYHVGRGSGANSIVSYCLGLSEVCPLELNLYFERFLNPARATPPDFDLDWSWQERDQVLDYIFKRFGTERTAFVGTIGTFKYRSTLRELGKVFGLAKSEIDQLTRTPPQQHRQDPLMALIHRYAQRLEGFPNLRSLHSCGVLISELPLTCYTALEMPPKGFQTAQIDMYIAERIGFEKLDLLSQRGIGHIRDCVKLVKENRKTEVDIYTVDRFKQDDRVNEHLRRGDTLGCFYIESPAMRGLLKRLNCQSYETLVAASSIIRPGVAQSGMLREYIRRHHNPQVVRYLHPVFEQELGETYGVMVYQEDVLKIAHRFAGLSLAQADILRRAMSGKKDAEAQLPRIKARFFANCAERGYPLALVEEVYRQIASFAGYSFCKAHSASYAVESYQSLYLKVYYPLEFCVAVINNFGGFYRTEVYVHEARRAGGRIALPCVNCTDWPTTIVQRTVRLGFQHIKGFRQQDAATIVAERRRGGNYRSLADFLTRTRLGIEALEQLIVLQAFRFTGQPKQELLIQARLLHRPQQAPQQLPLFAQEAQFPPLPALDRTPIEDAFDEMELLGFTVSYSPFDLLQTAFRGTIRTKDFLAHAGQQIRLVGYLLCIKDVPTVKGMMNFGTWLDADGQLFDTTHFPEVLRRYPFRGSGCYLLRGKIVVEFGYPSLEIDRMARLPMVPDPRYADSTVGPSYRHLG
ncbi:MAG: DNA polymerase III subunit alpha, partial [Bacteroidetes bacterium]